MGSTWWYSMAQDEKESTSNQSRVAWLAEQIAYHSDLYYNQARSEISDTEFDALWDKLKSLDPNNKILHEVGPEPLPGTVKVEHKFPMRSLDKGTKDEDIIHFIRQTTF